MDFKGNIMNQNEQMLEKKKQENVLIKTVNEKEQTDNKVRGEFQQEVFDNEQIKQQDINAIRQMEKMSWRDKNKFKDYIIDIAESSGQLQKERKISGLRKSQREAIAKKVNATDKTKMEELKRVEKDKSDSEKLLLGSYLEMEDKMILKKERVDMTGHERRTRAAKNVQEVKASKENMEQDLDNLIQNMRIDALLERKYEPDPRLEYMRKVAIHFSHLLKERDETLGRQIICLGKKQKDPNYVWPEEVEVPQESREILKEKKGMFEKLTLHVKNITQNFGIMYEVKRSELRAMEMTKKQLEEDYELQPSAYTQKLLEEIDLRISAKRMDVEKTYEEIKNPSTDEEVIKRLKILEDVCGKLAQKAEMIEKEEVKEKKLAIEKEAKDLIANFKC